MARPTKTGIDYFPLDVVFDDKIGLIEAEFGVKGFAVVVKLFQKIYGGQGYYCEWNKEVALMFTRQHCPDVGVNVVSEIVSASIRRGVFDKDMFETFGILTSRGIQERYLEATKRRTDIKIENCYLLINNAQNYQNVCNNPINVCNNLKKDNKNTTKKSKVNKSKVKDDDNGIISESAVVKLYCNNINFTPSAIEIEKLMSYENELSEELMLRGIEIAVENNVRRFSYIEAIYKNWINQRITTLEQYKANEERRLKNNVSGHNSENDSKPKFEHNKGRTF